MNPGAVPGPCDTLPCAHTRTPRRLGHHRHDHALCRGGGWEPGRRNKCTEQADGASNFHQPLCTPAFLSHDCFLFTSQTRSSSFSCVCQSSPSRTHSGHSHRPDEVASKDPGGLPPLHCSNKTKAEAPFPACLPCIRSKLLLG